MHWVFLFRPRLQALMGVMPTRSAITEAAVGGDEEGGLGDNGDGAGQLGGGGGLMAPHPEGKMAGTPSESPEGGAREPQISTGKKPESGRRSEREDLGRSKTPGAGSGLGGRGAASLQRGEEVAAGSTVQVEFSLAEKLVWEIVPERDIRLEHAEQVGKWYNLHTTYHIVNDRTKVKIKRRYNDFLWLRNTVWGASSSIFPLLLLQPAPPPPPSGVAGAYWCPCKDY